MLSILLLSKSFFSPSLPSSLLSIPHPLSILLLLNCLLFSSPPLSSSSMLFAPFLFCSPPNPTLLVLSHPFSVICFPVFPPCMASPNFDSCHFQHLCPWMVNCGATFEVGINVVPNSYRGRLEFWNFRTSCAHILSILVEDVSSTVFHI